MGLTHKEATKISNGLSTKFMQVSVDNRAHAFGVGIDKSWDVKKERPSLDDKAFVTCIVTRKDLTNDKVKEIRDEADRILGRKLTKNDIEFIKIKSITLH